MDYSYRNPSKEGPTVDIWQGHTARKPPSINGIGMSRVSGNNQAADWGRLFDMMEDQKECFMDKDMLWGSTPAYIWYKEVRMLNEADNLKDQIADRGRSLEL